MEQHDEDGVSLNFPTIEELGLFDESRCKPATDWSILKIGSLQAKIEAFKASRKNVSVLFSDDVPLHKLMSFANEVFGYNGWSTDVLEVKILEEETFPGETEEELKYSFLVEAMVRVTLKDGTLFEDIGRGRGEKLPVKSMALSKAKKESVTNGIKCAIVSLSSILLEHEVKLRSGYYVEGYEDIFSY